MLKASALYIVIIIALVISVLCSALIVAAYFYKAQYQVKLRYERLQNNLGSGVHILLTSRDSSYRKEQIVNLFTDGGDSVSLRRYPWGILDIGVVSASLQLDTLYKVFSIANSLDSTKWSALYLIDEDRPLSLSGKTVLSGDAYIPKAGLKTAYVDNQAYTGDPKLILGHTHDSEKKLPGLTTGRLQILQRLSRDSSQQDSTLLERRETNRSFRFPSSILHLGKTVTTLQDIRLSGNIILYSDTTLIIDNTAILRDIIIFAKAIHVKSGFQGNCQLYASDSIHVENGCHLKYPSCLGVLRYKPVIIGFPEKITMDQGSTLDGLIFTYEKNNNPLPPVITIGKQTVVSGQVYAQGILSLNAGAIIRGNVMTSRFLYRNTFTAYENYLIGATIDATTLSPYFLSSDLSPVAGKSKKIMQWLEN